MLEFEGKIELVNCYRHTKLNKQKENRQALEQERTRRTKGVVCSLWFLMNSKPLNNIISFSTSYLETSQSSLTGGETPVFSIASAVEQLSQLLMEF